MGEIDPALVEKAVRAAVAHQRIPTFDDAGGHRCSGCDHLRGEPDGANSPRHAEHQVRAVLDAVAPAIQEAALLEAARHFEYEMAPAWGGDSTWISTGSHVADLVGSTLRDMAAQQGEERADGR